MKEKLKKLTKNKLAIGIFSVSTALVLALVSINVKTNNDEVKNIIVTTKKIEVGDKITEEMLGYKKLSGDTTGLITNKEDVLGKYAKISMVVNDYLTNEKLSSEAIYGSAYLENLSEDDRAISVSVTTNAKGLSGKLESGDIVSVILSEETENRTKKTYIPKELEFVEIISVSDSSGYDVGSNEEAEKIGSTVTLLVREEQGIILANAEQSKDVHFQLVYRGNDERKQQLLETQNKIINGEPLQETESLTEIESQQTESQQIETTVETTTKTEIQ